MDHSPLPPLPSPPSPQIKMSNPNTTNPTPPFEFKISIYTDTVCPFSHLGHLSLSHAITSFPLTSPYPCTFTLTYHPYILYPNSLPSSRTLGAALTSIYSSSHSQPTTSNILTHLTHLAHLHNTTFNWTGLTGNSHDSHRLLLLSQSTLPPPQHHNLITQLYKTGFELGLDISNRHTLAKLGVDAGLWTSEKEGIAWFESGELAEDVDKECERAKTKMGVRAVPSYVVNDRWVVGGMQDRRVWEGLFARIIAKSTTKNDTPEEGGSGGGDDGRRREGEEMRHGGNCKVVAAEEDGES